ncbi:hypothetical protein Tco_0525481 [Tanacetum coccineum]
MSMKTRQYIAITDHILWDILTKGTQTTTDPASPSFHDAVECKNSKWQLGIGDKPGLDELDFDESSTTTLKTVAIATDSNSKALVVTRNNEDIDWTKKGFNAEPVTYAMMALTVVEQDNGALEFDVRRTKILSLSLMATNSEGNPEEDLKDYAIIDSGCSGSMTGDKDKLSDFKEFKGGYVAFGNDSKGWKRITEKEPLRHHA